MEQEGPRQDWVARETATAEQIVQAQVDAYNRHDVEALLNTYAPEVKIYGHPNELRQAGLEQMRKNYTAFFNQNPNVRAVITARIAQGPYVIDHEELTGVPDSDQSAAVAIYEVREHKIVNVWFLVE